MQLELGNSRQGHNACRAPPSQLTGKSLDGGNRPRGHPKRMHAKPRRMCTHHASAKGCPASRLWLQKSRMPIPTCQLGQTAIALPESAAAATTQSITHRHPASAKGRRAAHLIPAMPVPVMRPGHAPSHARAPCHACTARSFVALLAPQPLQNALECRRLPGHSAGQARPCWHLRPQSPITRGATRVPLHACTLRCPSQPSKKHLPPHPA